MNDFIKKLETDKYIIGSFDVYEEQTRKLIEENSKATKEDVESILKSMPTSYRGAITDKPGNYLGYIGLYNVNTKDGVASLRFEVNKELSDADQNEILNEFKNYMTDSLNITEVEETIYKTKNTSNIATKKIIPKANIIIANKLLEPGVSEETLEKFSSDYEIPKLQMPFTIKSNDRAVGIIGLSNLIWSNKRANLNLFLDKSLGSDILSELPGYIIDDYIEYIHDSNVHNLNLSVNGSDDKLLDILKDTNMNYYGTIPYAALSENDIESKLMFQHIPKMTKQNGIYIPENKKIEIERLDTDKKELDKIIDLGNGYKLVSPKSFEDENINSENILKGYIESMQERQKFTIPLGEDKYFLQKGNGKYGLSKQLMNYNYVLLDDKNEYSGYINILRENANGKNAELEIGIKPEIQHKGLGTTVINKFYDELFSVGYASVTSSVFEFNKPSLKLHEKVAQLNGIRLDSYYINGKLWDMSYYTKTNDTISKSENGRHK